MARKAPRQGVDLNGGTYSTPRTFIQAVEREFGALVFDLAANDENHVAAMYYTLAEDSLSQAWSWITGGFCWLNPPYDDIGKWAKKAYSESLLGTKVLMLVPASVGTNWFRDFVYGKAEVRFLNGRLTFAGHKAPYPKDLMLVVYENGREPRQIIWPWRNE
jgi:phage N-6-adenine-methyltransferase